MHDADVREFTVIGPSMHPTLRSPSWTVTCDTCEISHTVVAVDGLPSQLICSNCGNTSAFPQGQPLAGASGLVDLAAYATSRPARDHIVAIDDGPEGLRAKRIMGLPGETVRIIDGDLWIDGRRYQKSIRQLQQRALLVHDDRYRQGGDSRWRAESGWVKMPQEHAWTSVPAPAVAAPVQSNWLVYHHYSPHAANGLQRESPVLDDYPGNQSIRRQLWPVRDVGVTFRIDAPAGTRCELAIWNGQRPVRAEITVGPGVGNHRVCVAWLDGRLVANVPLAAANAGDSASVPITAGRPVGIRPSCQESLAVRELRVIRDIHLLGPAGSELDWAAPRLATDRFFVLGDNAPVSRDSRHAPAGVPRAAILGQVKVHKN